MNKFHQISTDKFKPLSYDNTYLFNHYDKVLNFIKARIGHKYGHILAKPVQRGYEIEWFSPFNGLHDVSEKNNKAALLQYFEFQDLLNKQVEQLSVSNDPDAKNWASLLTKVFDKENNVIYSNGKDISVIWGWEFENNTIHRPTFGDFSDEENESESEGMTEAEELKDTALPEEPENKNEAIEPEPKLKPEPEEQEPEENLFFITDDEVDQEPEPETDDKKGFIEFLKEFAARYWWLLVLLLVLCVFVFFLKSLMYN